MNHHVIVLSHRTAKLFPEQVEVGCRPFDYYIIKVVAEDNNTAILAISQAEHIILYEKIKKLLNTEHEGESLPITLNHRMPGRIATVKYFVPEVEDDDELDTLITRSIKCATRVMIDGYDFNTEFDKFAQRGEELNQAAIEE